MIKKTSVFIGLIFLLFLFELFIYSVRFNSLSKVSLLSHKKIESFESTHNYSFCDEKIPLNSQEILEKFEKEILKNARWHKEIIMSYKRSGKYFPVIEKILEINGIPDDFKYLPVIESGLDNKTSPRGAAGFWQFMPHTGREYGLEINEHIDERYDLTKSTKAACKYFKQAHRKFKTWTLTAVSYNIGISGLKKKLRKQNSNNYFDLRLNSETSRYIYRVVAVKDILTHPSNYNFKLKPRHKYSPIRTKKIKVDYEIPDLSEWANQKGINFKILKMFNPWLRSNQLPNPEKNIYFIELPFEKISTFSKEASKSEVNELSKQVFQ